MITFHLPSATVERLAFAYSPILEAVLSLHVLIEPKPIQQGGIPIIMGAVTPAGIKRAARVADGFNPALAGEGFERLEGLVKTFRSTAEQAGRDPSALKIYVRVNGSISTTPLAEDQRPFLWGSPDQIAHDLDQVRTLHVEQVFFAEIVTAHLDEYIESLGRLQSLVRA